MARPGLTQHRKFRRLTKSLGGKITAMGVLELMWMPAYESGDPYIGTEEDLALRVEFAGEPKSLAYALLTCGGENEPGFIEPCPDRPGFQIHDLFDHAPEYVQRRMKKEIARIKAGRDVSEVRREAGLRGALARWQKPGVDILPSPNQQKLLPEMANGWQAVDPPMAKGPTPAPAPAPAPAQKDLARTKRASRKPKEPNPRHRPLQDLLVKTWEAETGQSYVFTQRDPRGIATLAKSSLSDDQLAARLRSALRAKGFDRPTDLFDFAAKVNRVSATRSNLEEFDLYKPGDAHGADQSRR